MVPIVSAERPLTVDLRLDCGVVLPHAVVREAESTAAALVRLTPNPLGSPAWQDYHSKFLDRYGLRSLVPIGELLNVESGLSFPVGYRGSRVRPPPRLGLSKRDAALLALAQNAALQQHTEIVLDDKMIADLEVGETTTTWAQPHTELRFRVHASTTKKRCTGRERNHLRSLSVCVDVRKRLTGYRYRKAVRASSRTTNGSE
jgi:hypothetical protein